MRTTDTPVSRETTISREIKYGQTRDREHKYCARNVTVNIADPPGNRFIFPREKRAHNIIARTGLRSENGFGTARERSDGKFD